MNEFLCGITFGIIMTTISAAAAFVHHDQLVAARYEGAGCKLHYVEGSWELEGKADKP